MDINFSCGLCCTSGIPQCAAGLHPAQLSLEGLVRTALGPPAQDSLGLAPEVNGSQCPGCPRSSLHSGSTPGHRSSSLQRHSKWMHSKVGRSCSSPQSQAPAPGMSWGVGHIWGRKDSMKWRDQTLPHWCLGKMGRRSRCYHILAEKFVLELRIAE